MQGIFQKENTDKALKYGIYRHLPTYEKIIRNLVSFFVKNSQKLIPCNAIKKTNPRNSKGSGCQKGHRIQTDINWRICWKNIFVYCKNQCHSYGCTYKKLKKKVSCFLFHFTLPICFFLICNCSEPSKISKNRYKMLAFLRLFLKFYLADTPHRRNA